MHVYWQMPDWFVICYLSIMIKLSIYVTVKLISVAGVDYRLLVVTLNVQSTMIQKHSRIINDKDQPQNNNFKVYMAVL